MFKSSFPFYPQQTFLDYSESAKNFNESDYGDDSTTMSGYSFNDSVDYGYGGRKVQSVENFYQYPAQYPMSQKRKHCSLNDMPHVSFLTNHSQKSERLSGKSLSEQQHLDSIILNGSASLGPKSKRKASEADFKVKYKTEVCRYWEADGTCPYGTQCAFAHGRTEMRSKALALMNYRTRKCNQFHEHGFCPYGARCQFLHSIRGSPEHDNMMTHHQEDCFQKQLENSELILMTSETECMCLRKFLRPRLPVFREITRDEEQTDN